MSFNQQLKELMSSMKKKRIRL